MAKKTVKPVACKHNFPKPKYGKTGRVLNKIVCTKCGEKPDPSWFAEQRSKAGIKISEEEKQKVREEVLHPTVAPRVEGKRGATTSAQTGVQSPTTVDKFPCLGFVPSLVNKRCRCKNCRTKSPKLRATAPEITEVEQRPGSTSANTTIPGGDARSVSDEFSFAAIAAKAESSRGNSPHLECAALAGTGKTTTVVQGLVDTKGGRPSITPSEQQMEVWKQLKSGKNDSVRISSFNASITNEMKDKVEKAGLINKGVEARGVHSLGLQTVTKTYGYFQAKTWAVQDKVWKALGVDPKAGKSNPKLFGTVKAVDDLVSLCKQTLSDTEPETLDQLCSRYDVEIEGGRSTVYDLVPHILEECKVPKGLIHFDDMVWLPVVNGLTIPKVDTQIIDEAQDLNRMMQELIYKSGHRIVFVGDKNQAIYGFAGADSESMDRMRAELAGNDGTYCNSVPLTVTRRCGKAIVEEARKYIPGEGFEAHSSNPDGIVDVAPWSWEGKGPGRKRKDWDKTYGPLVKPGAMVLCRVNAPLVSECFSFLKRGIKAFILGRKVGQGLTKLVKRSGADTVVNLIGWLDDWALGERAKEEAKKFPSEGRLQNLEDQVSCIAAFCEGCTYTVDVLTKIDDVFADKQCPVCLKGHDLDHKVCDRCPNGVELILPAGIKFSSIHKSKGLEAEQVFYLQPPGVGPIESKMQDWERVQERNLKYVAVTRAIKELYYVR